MGWVVTNYVVHYLMYMQAFELDEYDVWQDALDMVEDMSEGYGEWELAGYEFTRDVLRGLMLAEFGNYVLGVESFEDRVTQGFVVSIEKEIGDRLYLFEYEMVLSVVVDGVIVSDEENDRIVSALGLGD